MFVPHGGWPVLPTKLDDIIETQENLNRDMTALNAVLATTPQRGNLETVDFNQVEERLKALYDDKQALDNLPERARLERDFHSVGLDELIEDLNNRGIPNDAVAGELQLAWWTTAFEDIVKSSAIISNQDGSALQGAAERFAQVDVEHVRSIGPMVAQESMRRLCDMLFSRTQEANLLHTMLAGSHNVSLNRTRNIRRFSQRRNRFLLRRPPHLRRSPIRRRWLTSSSSMRPRISSPSNCWASSAVPSRWW